MDLERKAVSANRKDSETFGILGDTESSRSYHIFLLQYSESLLVYISPLVIISSPGSGRSLEEGMAAHSSILAWEIPWIEESGGLQSIDLQSQTQLNDLALSMHEYCSRDCVVVMRLCMQQSFKFYNW